MEDLYCVGLIVLLTILPIIITFILWAMDTHLDNRDKKKGGKKNDK